MDADADDELRDLTPVRDLADEIRAAIDERVALTPREAELRDAFVDVAAARLARHLEHAHRAIAATPRRLAQLEAWRTEVDAWRLRIAGVAERNGRLGKLDQDVAELREDSDEKTAELRKDVDQALAELRKDVGTSDERRAERATVKAVKWTTAKVLSLIGAAGLIAGGGVWQTLRAREAIAAAEGRRAGELDEHERTQDRLINHLLNIYTSRTP